MASVRGVKRLQKRLERLGSESKQNIAKASLKAANRIVDDMKRAAPIDDGDLRDSIRAQPGKRRARDGTLMNADFNQTSVAVTAGDKTAFYAPFVEFGTAAYVAGGRFKGAQVPARPAQPFFYPVWRGAQKKALGTVRRALNKALRGVPET